MVNGKRRLRRRIPRFRGTEQTPVHESRFPVVGLGASAGGLAALEGFFRAVPADLGVAFVVVVHLSPEHQSELPAILNRFTAMPVVPVTSVQPLRPNHVYVIPPDRKLEISNSTLAASPFDEPRGKRAAIDTFFRSLATEHGDGFAVILSGGGTDGALGVRASKEAGAFVLVQDPREASHDGMPRAAIATGLADLVLPVRELALRLAELVRSKQHGMHVLEHEPKLGDEDEQAFVCILALIRGRTAHDFSRYKRSTILRRIVRRMQLHQKASLDQYCEFLRGNSSELESLFDDLLISVTSFFRDPEAWVALDREVIGALLDQRPEGRPLRAWVAGCATGEEAYSLAILILERLELTNQHADISIFASDLDENSLAFARDGLYSSSIIADVSEERLRRFFRREGDRYQISRQVRDCVTFASHNLLRDPPFSGLDLVTCRNVLIYLNRPMQEQLISVFRYACRPGGCLFLGLSETAEGAMFASIDKKYRIFQTRDAVTGRLPALPELPPSRPRAEVWENRRASESKATAPVHRSLLEQLGPPSLIVDARRNVVHLSETVGRFLRPRGGPLVRDVLELVRPELQLELRARLSRALDKNEPGFSAQIAVSFEDSTRRVCVFVSPQPRRKDEEQFALVVFLDGGLVTPADASIPSDPTANDELQVLRDEIRELEQRMESTLEDHQLANEALRAANEELQSLNEEYRSTAEELETSKEELQSINEELQTVNVELKLKLEEVSRANDDLENLMAATEIGTLFLDRTLAIYRFTPRMVDLFNFQVSDRGRFIDDFTHRLDYHDLAKDAERVLATLVPTERRAKSSRGETFVVRFRPYRTLQDRIDGVVITFFDVTELTAIADKLRESERQLTEELAISERLYEMTTQAVAATNSRDALDEILKASIELQHADFGMLQLLDVQSGQLRLVAQRGFDPRTLGAFDDMGPDEATSYGRVIQSRTRSVIEDIGLQPGGDSAIGFAADGGYRAVHSVPLISDENALLGVLSTQFAAPRKISDRDKRVVDTLARQAANLIARWRSEESLMRLNDQLTRHSHELREQDKRKADFLATLGHELRNPLAAIRSAVALLDKRGRDAAYANDTEVQHMLQILTRQSLHMTHMVHDLLDITRITHGKLRLNLRVVDLGECVEHSVAAHRLRLERAGVKLVVHGPAQPVFLNADPDRLLQIVDNLLSNAINYGEQRGSIDVSVERVKGAAELRVRDHGRGMSSEVIAKIFEPFFQAGEPQQHAAEGLGLGLAVIRRLVELHGGRIEARSDGPGRGSEFTVRLPAVSSAPAERVALPQSKRRFRVLVVDDQSDVADALGGLLKSLGHSVHIAYGADAAIALTRSVRPEVAILDLAMPGMNGHDLAKRLRAESPNLRLIAISGYGVDDRRRGIEPLEFEEYLTKPPDIDALIRALETPAFDRVKDELSDA